MPPADPNGRNGNVLIVTTPLLSRVTSAERGSSGERTLFPQASGIIMSTKSQVSDFILYMCLHLRAFQLGIKRLPAKKFDIGKGLLGNVQTFILPHDR